MSSQAPIEVEDLELILVSADAILVDTGTRQVWLPKSVIEYDAQAAIGAVLTVTMPEWLAFREGLI